MRVFKILCLVLFFLCTACSKNSTSVDQKLTINIGTEPSTLDPRKARTLNEITLCRMLYEGLTRTSKEGKPEPALAEKIEIAEDGLKYTFHLRTSLWSNGDPVTSFDFADTWKAILNPSFPSDIAYQLYLIKNGQKVKSGELGSEALGVETPDALTLVVHLESPAPYFLDICSMNAYYPVPKVAFDGHRWMSEPDTFVGNGPFILSEWNHSDQITVVKNPTYWESEAVEMEEIDLVMVASDTEIRMFEENKLDWAGSPLSTLPVDAFKDLKEKKQLKVSALSGTSFLRVNTEEMIGGKKNPLSLIGCRKALAIAIDRKGITEHILQGGHAPALSLVPREMGLFGSGYFSDQNQNVGAQLFQEGLIELGLEKNRMEPIVLSFLADERNMAIAQAVQKNWETNLGIAVQLEAVEKKVFYQKIKQRNYQLALGSWIADFNDPINFLEVFKFKHASTNNTNWENGKYIDLLNRSQLCTNLEARNKLLAQAEEILMAEMPVIPIFHYVMNYLEKEGVEDVALSPIGGLDFRWAKIR